MEYEGDLFPAAFASDTPANVVPSIMVAWGLVMTLMCRVNTYEGLVV